jgi:CHRD domain
MRKGFAFLALVFVAAAGTAQVASFRAVMTGANETPVAADPDGLGNGYFTLDPTAGTVTFNLCVFNINPPTAAHIHRGGSNFGGLVVVGPFSAPFVNGCATGTETGVATSLINEIIANPAGFYANIHNADFPGGAIRGQLTPAPGTFSNPILFAPVVAKVTGAKGENFVEELRLVNRSPASSNVTLDFFASSSAALTAPTATRSVTVAANSQMVLNDVLGTTFATSGIGALRITADKDVIASGHLLNDQRSSAGGTTGEAFSAGPVDNTCRNGTLPLLSNSSAADLAAGLGFRTNIGYFNPTTLTVTIVFTAKRNDGSTIATKTVTVASFAHTQVSLAGLFDSASASDLTQTDFFVTYTVSGGPAVVYAAVADNKTGDNYFVSPACN